MQLERKLGVLGYDSTHNQLQSSLEELLTAEGSARSRASPPNRATA